MKGGCHYLITLFLIFAAVEQFEGVKGRLNDATDQWDKLREDSKKATDLFNDMKAKRFKLA